MLIRCMLTAVAILSAGIVNAAYGQDAWDIVVNGRSFHIDAAKEWNEDNWGLGIEREFDTSSRWVKVALANGLKDSFGEPSYFAGGGVKRRFRVRSDDLYVDLGVIGFVMTREDVNHNQPFPGLLPAVTVGGKRVALNVTYMPEFIYDRVMTGRLIDPGMNGVLFLQLKLDASLFGFGGKSRPLLADSFSGDRGKQ
jgi:Antimicrobial peptide resistance and lipid A acylation protein PagP